MLPTDLLMSRHNGEELMPKQLPINSQSRAIATELITTFQQAQHQTQKELDRQLQELEGESTDYRVKRGLAHLLKSEAFSQFEMVSPLDPQLLRQRVFALSAQSAPLPQTAVATLEQLACQLSEELAHEVLPDQIRRGLYADLSENRILSQFTPPTPDELLHRYNLSQVQGVFYKASQIRINAHRNDPGEYKLLFRYLKLFGLMTYIEGDADHGFTISIDGPTSLFKASTRYGLDIAKLIPALLHVTKWSLSAELQVRDPYTSTLKTRRFSLDSACGLVTHYPPGKPYDSMLESAFADRWSTLKTDWRLEREVDLIPVPGSVMIPDFRLVHPNGRTFLLEIVGYWRPEYLRKKFFQVRQSGCNNLILAVSERLNLEKAGVRIGDTPAHIVWFRDKLAPKSVLSLLESESSFTSEI
jgi:predicted nuclease of restriction endonuclease-like RecB superfamily